MPERPQRERLSLWLAIRRGAFWSVRLARYGLWRALLVLNRKTRLARRALIFRQLLEDGGAVSHWFGQQLSIRTDRLNPLVCDELRKLLDKAPPMTIEQTLEVLESAYGCSPEKVFRHLDPEPIKTGSIACVYHAELHSGKRVAVKVRRPGLVATLEADLGILHRIASLLEGLAVMRAGEATSVTTEVRRALLEAADFTIEARYLELFRKDARKYKYASAPKLYPKLSNEKVLVTEFCSGAFVSEFLTAIEPDDNESLQKLLSRGFDLRKIAVSLGHSFFRGAFEADVFHAEVHPASIIVRPDNSLIFIDFDSCSRLSRGFREKLRQLLRAIYTGDSRGAATATLTLCEPIPLIETNAALDELQELYRSYHLAVRSKHSDWLERTLGGLLVESIKILGQSGVNANTELVRFCRAAMLVDTMLYRLHPRWDPAKELWKYNKKYYKRRARRVLEEALQLRPEHIISTLGVAADSAERALRTINRYLDIPRFSFMGSLNKLWNVLSTFVTTGFQLALVLLFVTVGRTVAQLRRAPVGELLGWQSLGESMSWSALWLPYQLVAGIALVVAFRKIMLTLRTVEVKNEL